MARPAFIKRFYGFWRCDHCGAEVNGRYDKCLRCGGPIPLPRPNQISVFYLKPGAQPVEEATAEAMEKAGPDWVCGHCTTNNSGLLRACTGCGNVRENADATRKKVRYGRGQKVPQTWEETFVKPGLGGWWERLKNSAAMRFLFGTTGGCLITGGVVLGLVIWFFIWFTTFHPPVLELTLKTKSWKRVVPIERWKTVRESDWSIPATGKEISREEKVHHYNHVVDHYETKQVQRSRSVPDGEESYTETVDNGDGSFSTETHTRTTYRTEYYYEDVTEPVYRDDPVYQTWYTYDIDKWAYERQADTAGSGNLNGWPAFKLREGEREGTRYTMHYFHFESVDPEVRFSLDHEDLGDSLWNAVPVGGKIRAELTADSTLSRILPAQP